MANAEGMNVKQSSKGLIREELDFKRGKRLVCSANVRVKISLVVLHNYVQILTIGFFCCESTQNSHCELSLEH